MGKCHRPTTFRNLELQTLLDCGYRNTSDRMVILRCCGPNAFFLERVVFPSRSGPMAWEVRSCWRHARPSNCAASRSLPSARFSARPDWKTPIPGWKLAERRHPSLSASSLTASSTVAKLTLDVSLQPRPGVDRHPDQLFGHSPGPASLALRPSGIPALFGPSRRRIRTARPALLLARRSMAFAHAVPSAGPPPTDGPGRG